MPIRIHSWGGYGSQLNTANLLLKVKRHSKKRPLVVVHHSSGVTRRDVEFPFGVFDIRVEFRDDFIVNEAADSTYSFYRYNFAKKTPIKFRKIVKNVLDLLRISVSIDKDEDINRLMPWTFSIRGHYSFLSFGFFEVYEIFTNICYLGHKDQRSVEDVLIHFRLGDLLSLVSKSPVDPARIVYLLSQLSLIDNDICFYSDSDSVTTSNMLKAFGVFSKALFVSTGAESTICAGVDSRFFIGTNSKISIWIAVFRSIINKQESYLPHELARENLHDLGNIYFY